MLLAGYRSGRQREACSFYFPKRWQGVKPRFFGNSAGVIQEVANGQPGAATGEAKGGNERRYGLVER